MKAPSFLPPSALQAEVTRTKRLKEDSEDAAKVCVDISSKVSALAGSKSTSMTPDHPLQKSEEVLASAERDAEHARIQLDTCKMLAESLVGKLYLLSCCKRYMPKPSAPCIDNWLLWTSMSTPADAYNFTRDSSLAEKRDGAQADVDILAHLISLFQASKQQKDERLASIEAEVSDAQVQLLQCICCQPNTPLGIPTSVLQSFPLAGLPAIGLGFIPQTAVHPALTWVQQAGGHYHEGVIGASAHRAMCSAGGGC